MLNNPFMYLIPLHRHMDIYYSAYKTFKNFQKHKVSQSKQKKNFVDYGYDNPAIRVQSNHYETIGTEASESDLSGDSINYDDFNDKRCFNANIFT